MAAVTETSSAADLCAAFFAAMDTNGNGFIEEAEVKAISMKAFGEDDSAAATRWTTMLAEMDANHDTKISKEEYTAHWMKTTSEKISADGTYCDGYAKYLLDKLALLS